MSDNEAAQLTADPMEIGEIDILVNHADGGDKIDEVPSRTPGTRGEPMGLEELERLTDTAIRHAWKQLTGKPMPPGEDPVEFINTTKGAS